MLTIFLFSFTKALLNTVLHKTISKQLTWLHLDFSQNSWMIIMQSNRSAYFNYFSHDLFYRHFSLRHTL